MTPQELIETAQSLNPEKFKSHPHEALLDAYAFKEAARILARKLEPKIEPQNEALGGIASSLGIGSNTLASDFKGVDYSNPRPARKNSARPRDRAELVKDLQKWITQNGKSFSQAANLLGVSSSNLYLWFSGKNLPGPGSADRIENLIREK